MRRLRQGLTAVLLLPGVLAVGGAWAQPPPGVPGAQPGFPPPGTRLVTRRTDDQGTTTTRTWVILEEGSHEGRPVFRGAVGGTVVMTIGPPPPSPPPSRKGATSRRPQAGAVATRWTMARAKPALGALRPGANGPPPEAVPLTRSG